MNLKEALEDVVWKNHKLGKTYHMDGKKALWKIAYYPIFENGKNGEEYNEPRALAETPMDNGGIDYREVPLRYLAETNEK